MIWSTMDIVTRVNRLIDWGSIYPDGYLADSLRSHHTQTCEMRELSHLYRDLETGGWLIVESRLLLVVYLNLELDIR